MYFISYKEAVFWVYDHLVYITRVCDVIIEFVFGVVLFCEIQVIILKTIQVNTKFKNCFIQLFIQSLIYYVRLFITV